MGNGSVTDNNILRRPVCGPRRGGPDSHDAWAGSGEGVRMGEGRWGEVALRRLP